MTETSTAITRKTSIWAPPRMRKMTMLMSASRLTAPRNIANRAFAADESEASNARTLERRRTASRSAVDNLCASQPHVVDLDAKVTLPEEAQSQLLYYYLQEDGLTRAKLPHFLGQMQLSLPHNFDVGPYFFVNNTSNSKESENNAGPRSPSTTTAPKTQSQQRQQQQQQQQQQQRHQSSDIIQPNALMLLVQRLMEMDVVLRHSDDGTIGSIGGSGGAVTKDRSSLVAAPSSSPLSSSSSGPPAATTTTTTRAARDAYDAIVALAKDQGHRTTKKCIEAALLPYLPVSKAAAAAIQLGSLIHNLESFCKYVDPPPRSSKLAKAFRSLGAVGESDDLSGSTLVLDATVLRSRCLGMGLSTDDAETVVNMLDADASGEVDMEEFQRTVLDIQQRNERSPNIATHRFLAFIGRLGGITTAKGGGDAKSALVTSSSRKKRRSFPSSSTTSTTRKSVTNTTTGTRTVKILEKRDDEDDNGDAELQGDDDDDEMEQDEDILASHNNNSNRLRLLDPLGHTLSASGCDFGEDSSSSFFYNEDPLNEFREALEKLSQEWEDEEEEEQKQQPGFDQRRRRRNPQTDVARWTFKEDPYRDVSSRYQTATPRRYQMSATATPRAPSAPSSSARGGLPSSRGAAAQHPCAFQKLLKGLPQQLVANREEGEEEEKRRPSTSGSVGLSSSLRQRTPRKPLESPQHIVPRPYLAQAVKKPSSARATRGGGGGGSTPSSPQEEAKQNRAASPRTKEEVDAETQEAAEGEEEEAERHTCDAALAAAETAYGQKALRNHKKKGSFYVMTSSDYVIAQLNNSAITTTGNSPASKKNNKDNNSAPAASSPGGGGGGGKALLASRTVAQHVEDTHEHLLLQALTNLRFFV